MATDVLLIDGSNLAHRAYNAARQSRPEALAMLDRMLQRYVSALRPAAVAIAWDSATSWRREIYPEYREDRFRPPGIDEFIAASWSNTHRPLRYVDAPGHEADDVIASLVDQARQLDWSTPDGRARAPTIVLVSGDQDLLQLVAGDVSIVIPGGPSLPLNPNNVYSTRGLWPTQVPLFQALAGDRADNIPGLPGIGDVTALKALRGRPHPEANIESILDRLPVGRLRCTDEEALELTHRWLRLTRLATDAPVSRSLEDCYLGGGGHGVTRNSAAVSSSR